MKTSTIITALALSLLSTAALAQSTPSPCKGVAEGQCATTAGCRWQAAQVAGEASKRTGKAYTRNVKAHCRKGRTEVAKS